MGENGKVIWRKINTDGFGDSSNVSTRGMVTFGDYLYVGVLNLKPLGKIAETFASSEFIHRDRKVLSRKEWDKILQKDVLSKGCEIWRWNGEEWECVVGDKGLLKRGFGNSHNWEASILIPFKNRLYAGTLNMQQGCEIWRTEDGMEWEQVMGKSAEISNGFGDPTNRAAWSAEIFRIGNKEYLYIGTVNWWKGCEVWRTEDGEHWEAVAGNVSKTPNGFKRFSGKNNVFAWSMVEFNRWLYVGTAGLKWHVFPRFALKMIFRYLPISKGCQVWRTFDGITWEPVVAGFGIRTEMPNGFGDKDNWGVRRMKVFKEKLFVGTATNVFECYKACEIWCYDGYKWEKLVGGGGKSGYDDGFNDPYNKYAWGMEIYKEKRKEKLYVAVSNPEAPSRKGSEIWVSENGTTWKQEVGDEAYENGIGPPDGFGDRSNRVRSMGVFNGKLYAGTYNLRTGCQVWERV